MEEITLHPITPENWEECIALSVRDDQKDYVSTNLYSLAEAKIYPECTPLAIYSGEKMIGFLMFGISREDHRFWLIRYMIDQRYQGQGYGRAAFRAAIEEMRKHPGSEQIYLSYHPENQAAENLYNSFGFQPTGEILEGEKVSRLDFNKM